MRGLRSVAQVAIGTAIGVLIGGSLVWAHGGDTARVHACVQPPGQPNTPNVRIVDASEACPTGWTTIDWSIAGPAGPPGPAGSTGAPGAIGPPGPAGPSPSMPEIKQSVVRIGIPRDTIRHVTAASGPTRTNTIRKDVTARCPRTHPLVISGGYELDLPPRGAGLRLPTYMLFRINGRTGGRPDGWRVQIDRRVGVLSPWRLVVRAECSRTS